MYHEGGIKVKVFGKNVFNEINPKSIRKIYLSSNFKDQNIMQKIKDLGQNQFQYLNQNYLLLHYQTLLDLLFLQEHQL